MADFARVDNITCHKRGSAEFDRLSEGKDTITCYDLTVDTHPSFFVGESKLLVHNCTDTNQSSFYNESEYWNIEFDDADVELAGGNILNLIDPPGTHAKYKNFWIGCDVGMTIAPTAIVIFSEVSEKKSAPPVLKLLGKLILKRIKTGDQATLVLHLIDIYRPLAFALDSTGVGLGLYDYIQDKARENPELRQFQERIKGYNFSQKIVADWDDTVEIDPDDPKSWEKAEIRRSVLERSTDVLRALVDDQRIQLPWDRELLGEFQGQSWCVDKETEILTKRGWLKYDEVLVGDETLGLNQQGESFWTPISKVKYFEGVHKVAHLQGQCHDSVTTLNHRWFVRRHGNALEFEWVTTEALLSDKTCWSIPISSDRVDFPTEKKYSDEFVELVAWIFTEGGVVKAGNHMTITQSPLVNQDHCDRIENLLVKMLGSGDINPGRGNPSKLGWSASYFSDRANTWRILDSRLLASLREVFPNFEKVFPIDFLNSLTKEQLDLFINVSLLGDGCEFRRVREGRQDCEVREFTQKSYRMNLFEYALALRGFAFHTKPKGGVDMESCTLLKRNFIHSGSMKSDVYEVDGVWCPVTGSGNWYARRNGSAYFTGNTYAKAALDPYGRKRVFSAGAFHSLDACRMAVLAYKQNAIEQLLKAQERPWEAPPTIFL
jgi:hypothetical protein